MVKAPVINSTVRGTELFTVSESCCCPPAGRGDNSHNRSGFRLGLQEVPGVWRQRRGNQETDRNPAEKGTTRAHWGPLIHLKHLIFIFINANRISIDWLESCGVDN